MENDHEQMQGAFRNTSRSKFCGLANKLHIEQSHGLGTANCLFFLAFSPFTMNFLWGTQTI